MAFVSRSRSGPGQAEGRRSTVDGRWMTDDGPMQVRPRFPTRSRRRGRGRGQGLPAPGQYGASPVQISMRAQHGRAKTYLRHTVAELNKRLRLRIPRPGGFAGSWIWKSGSGSLNGKSGSLEVRKCQGAVKPLPAPSMWLCGLCNFSPTALHHPTVRIHGPYLRCCSGRSRETRRCSVVQSGKPLGHINPRRKDFPNLLQPSPALRCPALLYFYMQRKKSTRDF
jgi:hypothetical protein